MEFVLGVLCALTIVLAFITVVGHGLWLLFAAIFKPSGSESRTESRCVSCGRMLLEGAVQCHHCGSSVARPSTPSPGDEIAATIRQLQLLQDRNLIDAAEFVRLSGLLRSGEAAPTEQPERTTSPASWATTPQPTAPAASRQPTAPAQPAPAGQSSPFATADSDRPVEPTTFAEPTAPTEPTTPTAPTAPTAPTWPTAQEVEFLPAESAASPESTPVYETTPARSPAPSAPPPVRSVRPAAHALDRDYASAAPQPSAQRQAIAELLKSFMAEKNIRWGEVVSGMLIVGSAVGLVISLRATLSEAIPYFPALIFMLITLGIHGAGIYTLRRWDLRSTSQGVLTIALLLTPLNFLAAIIISGSEERAVTDPMYQLAVAVGIAVVGWVTFSAGRALVPGAWWRLTAVIGATSIGQLIIDRQAGTHPTLAWTSMLAALPVAGFLLATVSQLGRTMRWQRISAWRGYQMLLVLGIATFALLPPLGLLVYQKDPLRIGMAQIAPAFSLAAAVILATGLLLHRRVVSARLAALQTAGTAIAIGGGMLMGAAVVLAWPDTDLLIAVGFTNFVILVVVAVLGRLPVLHIAAVACLALAVLVGFHAAQGSLADVNTAPGLMLLRAFATGRSSVVLSVLAILATVVAGLLSSGNRPLDALNYLLSAAGLAIVSVLLAAFAGFGPGGDTYLATPVFAFYGIAAIAAAKTLNLRGDPRSLYVGEIAAWSGSGLLLATLVHGLWLNPAISRWLDSGGIVLQLPLVVACLLHAGICVTLAFVFARKHILEPEVDRQQGLWAGLVNPLAWSALTTSLAVLPAFLSIQENVLVNHAAYLFAAAYVWLLASVAYRRAEWFAAFQVLFMAGVTFVLARFCRDADWGRDWWADPRHIQVQLIGLSLLCLLWSLRRRISMRYRALADLLDTPWPGADEVLLGLSLLGLGILAITGCWPGVMYEMGVTSTLSVDSVHATAYGLGSWIALAVISLALLVPARGRWPEARLVGLLIAGAVIPLLVSARWESDCSTVSALRWTFALYTLGTATLFWLREPIGKWLGKIRWLGLVAGGSSKGMCDVALLLGGLPVVLLTSAVVWRSVADMHLGAPTDGMLFSRMSLTFSFAVPLMTLVAVLLGHALREKRTGYALGGSALFQYVICLAYMLQVDGSSPGFLAGILQWNAVALAGYALLWLGLKPWMQPTREPADAANESSEVASADPSLALQLAATWGVLFIMAIWAALSVFLTPADFSLRTLPLGETPSYVAWALSLLAAVWCVLRYPGTLAPEALLELLMEPAGSRETDEKTPSEPVTGPGWKQFTPEVRSAVVRNLVPLVAYFALALVAFVAVSMEPLDTLRHWLAYHVLSYGWLTVAAVLTAASFRWQTLRGSAILTCVLVTLLAIWGSVSDPSAWAPWWSVGAAAGVFVLTVVLSLRSRSQWLAYCSIVPLILATSFYWIGGFTGRWPVQDSEAVADFVQANLIALLCSAVLWLFVDLWYQRTEQSVGFDTKFSLVPVHVTAGLVGLMLSASYFMGAFCINTLARGASSTTVFHVTNSGGAITLAILATLLVGALWEVRRSYALPCLYAWGVIVIAFGLDGVQLPIRTAFFAVGLAAAGYVMLTGLIWRQGILLASVANSWSICDPVRSLKRTATWLPLVNLLIGGASMLATLLIVMTFPERWMRVGSGMGPVLLAVGLATLAQKERRTLLEYCSLLMTGIAAVCLSWADLEPQWFDRMILIRMVRLLVVSAGLAFVYSVLVSRLARLTESWMEAVRKIAVTFGVVALLSLISVLFLEAMFFKPGVGAPVETPQILAVVVVLVGLIAGFISLALLPGKDPFTLSDRGRRAYVYAAELVAALIFAHVFLCCPWMFHGHVRPYWPYIVMGIAFVAVGVGELFRRTGIEVLSEPLQHTSFFLPLLPALGFWVIAAEQTHYATLMFFIGLMYLLLSGFRRSVASGLAAALAGNAALWSLLSDADVSIWSHPQFWLIPPAVSALIAGQINRRRLTESQLAALRYTAVLVIYLSSTSEIFLEGIGVKLWPPMLLAGLSVAGFFLGIVLRVRSFLILGASFVLLSVISMVWHAHVAIQHSWPLWAFGIGLGICILVLFGLFEKQRPQLTAWVERIQQWED